MEQLSAVLGGLGGLGLVLAVVMAVVVLFFLPWWAIIDCLVSRRSGGAKAVGVVLLVVTWGVGSVVYGLFLAKSRALRFFTLIAFFGVGLLFFSGMITLGTFAGIHSRYRAEETRRQQLEAVSQFQPASIPESKLGEFHAVHFTYGDFGPATAALARFTLAGPDFGTARDVDKSVRHVACDAENGRCFALTTHDFGTITTPGGRFAKVEVDSSLSDFSWPKGIAFDPGAGQVYVMTSHVATQLYKYDPRTSVWQRLPTEIRDLPLVALAYSGSDGCLYGLEFRPGDLTLHRIHRFNTAGASLGAIELHPAIPLSEGVDSPVQLAESGGRLVVVLPPLAWGAPEESRSSGNRILVVDPTSGEVLRPDPSL